MNCYRLGLSILFVGIFASLSLAQKPSSPPPEDQPRLDTGLATPPEQVVREQKPPEEPYIIEDGGFSIEPIYWLNRAQPDLRGGAAATEFGSIDYPGSANASVGAELSMPAGHSDTLRISYFRVQGHANTTVAETASIFGEGYNPGDYIVENYTFQSAKISWDYLSYTWYKPSGKIRLKTLYEMQFDTIGSNYDAPLKPVTTDTSGNTDYNTASGSKNIFLPTFGIEFEQALGRRLRWEVKGSGFGIPHRANIWDAQADLAIPLGHFELIAGGKAYHFKTSPQGSEYFTDTLSGAFAGIRYYLGKARR